MKRSIATALAVAVLSAGLLSACEEKSGVRQEIEKAEVARESSARVNLEASNKYLAQQAAQPGWTKTTSGIVYRITKTNPADLPRPTADAEVLAHYEGKLIDGKIFDSSYERGQPAPFQLRQVIPGWTEALQLIKPGEIMEAVIPPQLAYGTKAGPEIGPNQALVFKIELIAFRGEDGKIIGDPRAATPGPAGAPPPPPKK